MSSTGVAVIGMACLFPGAPNLDAYWNNILRKVDSVTDPPKEAWDPDVYYDPDFTDADGVYCKRGGFLGELATFDPLAHGIPPLAVGGEPDQWLALQVARDALADAGCSELDAATRRRTAVILGKGTYLNGGNALAVQRSFVVAQTLEIIKSLQPELTEDELSLLKQDMRKALPPMSSEAVAGLIPNIIVGRIANRLDLMGPSYTVDAACASSLVALERAISALNDRECDLALVGGSQVWVPVATLNVFCRLGALSRRQQIRPFDEAADGTLLGEGIGMVVIKRLADAERDGNRVYAVIRGVGVASDGRGVSVMAPRVEGEELALRRAYEAAGISPATVGLIEAHGTGTPVGDMAEVQALTRVFGPRGDGLPWCALGSVKSMISHTMPAAGIAGLIKAALALHHKVLPPTLNCDRPNPKLELEQTPFYINTETRPWIHGAAHPRRAGVNAFGFGGIDAHVVLEEHLPGGSVRISDGGHCPAWDSEVLVLEGGSREALLESAGRLAEALSGEGAPEFALEDLAWSLNSRLDRSDPALRLALVATSISDLKDKLTRAGKRLANPACRQIKDVSGIYYAADPLGREGKLAFLFPGENAQYPNMLADLCLHFPEARAWFDLMDRISFGNPEDYLLSDRLFPRPAFSGAERERTEAALSEMAVAVRAVLSANQALLTVLRGLGLRPDVIAGHSTGEFSAIRAAGIVGHDSEEWLAGFVRELKRNYDEIAAADGVPRAVFVAVGAERERVEAIAREAGGEISVALDNCPHQAVLVGEREAAGRAVAIVEREGLVYQRLSIDRAYHTPAFAPYTEHLREIFARTAISAPEVPIYSSTTAAPYPSDEKAVRELIVDHWIRPVEFRRTIEALHADGVRLFVEVGPRGNLTGFVEDILRGRPYAAIPADVQRRSGVTQLNHLAGLLAVHGLSVDMSYLYARRSPQTLDLGRLGERAKRLSTARPLATGFPPLRLSEETVRRIRESHRRQTAAPAASMAKQAAEAGAELPRLERPPAELPPGFELPAAEVEPLAASASPVLGFLGVMDQFLDVQEQVMTGYLGGPCASGGQAAGEFPLLAEVTFLVEGCELVAERWFDRAHDRFLLDHTFGRSISVANPDLRGLAVMPLAMSLEMAAEAASYLLPGNVAGMRDVHATRWIAFGDEPQKLRVSATVQDRPGEVRVEIRNLTEEADRPAAPVLTARVLMSPTFPEMPATRAPAHESRRSPEGTAALYRDGMFHGPSWQAVESIDAADDGRATATLRVLPAEDLLSDGAAARFVLDPIALDAAGQVIGFWTMERLERGKVIFPFRVDGIDLFGPPRAPGETLRCQASIQLVGGQLVRSDIDLLTEGGELWMRLTGWMDKRFDLPPRFLALMSPGGQADVSDPCPAAIPLPRGERLEIRAVDTGSLSDAGFWSRVWAQRILSEAERQQFKQLRKPEHRRLEWLGARAAAKEAVRRLLAGKFGLELQPADVEIVADESGRPVVGGPCAAASPAPVTVSLSHSNGLSVALAAIGAPGEQAPRVGLDIERVRARATGFADMAFSPAERQLFGCIPPGLAEEWLTRAWCAKEAVAKGAGFGLLDGLKEVAVEAVDVPRGWVWVRLSGAAARGNPDLSVPLVAYTATAGDLVVAATLCEPAPSYEPVETAKEVV
ncbi:MAG: polyketide synthase dehydratase domain-containing protein [Chloroflexota bacterium]|nr:polyketide synthase dehydratase domain-containing protein [Chloroflexota bacterium]